MRRFTVTQVKQNPKLLRDHDKMPFQVTFMDRVVCEVIPPGTKWPTCENCKEVTNNVMRFKDKGKWRTLTLCEKCKEELL